MARYGIDLLIHDGFILAPFYIFVKCVGKLDEDQLLKKLGLVYTKKTAQQGTNDLEKPGGDSDFYIINDGVWIHLMDNFFYNLWTSKPFRTNLAKIGLQYELYFCSIGDIDASFDFTYYKNGKKVREYIIKDPHFTNGILVKNQGAPLPKEASCLNQEDTLSKVLELAKSLGIKLHHEPQNIQFYECSNILPDHFDFTDKF